jgi:hypothetical protein
MCCSEMGVYLLNNKFINNMNQLKYLVIILLPIIFCSCERPADLTKVEINKILNEIIATDSSFYIVGQISSKFVDLELSGEMKKEFTPIDLRFISRQKRTFHDLTIEQNTLQCYWPGKKTFDFMKIVASDWKKNAFYIISFPIISADRTKVLIEIDMKCNIPLCGHGSKRLYIKKNGKWKIEKEYDIWES